MAEKKVRLNHKTDSGYDQLYPMSDGSIINYDNTESGATAVNVQGAIDEAFENVEDVSGTVGQLRTTVQSLATSVNGMVIVANGVTVNANAWVADTTYEAEGYNFKADITISGATADYVPEVDFSVADSIAGKYCSTSQSGNNKVRIWATEVPNGAIYIPTIKLVKDADGTSQRMLNMSGDGNSSYCYVNIAGTKRYGTGTYMVAAGTTITCYVYGENNTYAGLVTADGTQLLKVTNQTTGYVDYTVQNDAYIAFEYTSTSTQRHGIITIITV